MFVFLNKPGINNILLIDINVPDYQEIVDSVNDNTLAIVYDYNCTYAELLNIFLNYTVHRVGIFFQLNSIFLNNKTFFETSFEMIEFINQCNIKNIDFLACNTLNYPEWVDYYAKLPCIIGASNDKTGNIKYGGDWIMETTKQDIEFIYFTQNIEYYKYLLDLTFFSPTGSTDNISSIVTFYDSISNSNFMILPSWANGYWGVGCVFNSRMFTKASEFNNFKNIYSATLFKSAFNTTASNKVFVIIASVNNSIGYIYNCTYSNNTDNNNNTGGQTGTTSINDTWLATTATLSNTTSLAIYNNRLFYSLKTGNIGSAIITDASPPTIGTNNVAYIGTSVLGSSTSLYPMGLTTDTNGYLYVVLGNVTSLPTTGIIQIINITSTPSYLYTISLTTANITSWGNPYCLLWDNNTLYVGTTIGSTYTSTSGSILKCSTTLLSSSTTLSLFRNSIGSLTIYGVSGMSIIDGMLYASPINNSGFTKYVTQISLINTGFYTLVSSLYTDYLIY